MRNSTVYSSLPALLNISTVKNMTASIPLYCWNNNSANPMTKGLITIDEKNTFRVNRLGGAGGSSHFLKL